MDIPDSMRVGIFETMLQCWKPNSDDDGAENGGQSNLTKRPHRRRTRTVQSYWPGGANVHPI